jgi:hypothetical protein
VDGCLCVHLALPLLALSHCSLRCGDGGAGGCLGVGRLRGQPDAGEHAEPEQQDESDQARPGREMIRVWLVHDACSFCRSLPVLDVSQCGRPAAGPCLVARTGMEKTRDDACLPLRLFMKRSG